jgi:hypothetical protein
VLPSAAISECPRNAGFRRDPGRLFPPLSFAELDPDGTVQECHRLPFFDPRKCLVLHSGSTPAQLHWLKRAMAGTPQANVRPLSAGRTQPHRTWEHHRIFSPLMEQEIAIVESLMLQLSQPVHLVGHSFGGSTLPDPPVMLLIPLLGEAATTSWPPWHRVAIVFEPISPVPPMTTIFMTLPLMMASRERRHSRLTGSTCKIVVKFGVGTGTVEWVAQEMPD